MSDLPINWPEKPLGDLFDLARQPVTPNAYPEEEFAHYSIPAWDEKRGPAVELGASIGSAKTAITQPTILVSKLNPRIPRVVHLENPQGLRHCASTEFIPYVAKSESVILRFYSWFFESELFQRRLERIATGSTNSHKRARPSETLGWNIPFPLPDDQQSVAAVLDAVDEAIAKTEAVIAKLRQVRAGLLHDLLTRGLDPHGQIRDPIAHPEQFQPSLLGQIPTGWSVQTLEQITDPQAPICYGIVQVFDFVPNGVLVLAIRDLLGDYATGLHRTALSIDANYARSRVRPGDVLISIKGTIGRVGLVPPHYIGNISRDLARVRPLDRTSPAFLVHLLRSPLGQKTLELAQVGTTRAELSIAPLKRIPFAFPQRAEQDQIATVLDTQDGLVAAHESELAKLVQLKSGLMTDLLTGRVRVPETRRKPGVLPG